METDRLIDNNAITEQYVDNCGCSSSTSAPITSLYGAVGTEVANNTLCPPCNGHHPTVSIKSSIQRKIYKRRWYILMVYSLLALMQGGLCNVWTVIAESANAAFGWTYKLISLMQGWLFITFLLTMFPISLLMDKRGLRPAMILSAAAVTFGTLFRCVTTRTPYVTWLANLGQIMNGAASPVMFTAGPVISALWFPVEQRTTATAITTIAGLAGDSLCFIVGPLLIDQPHGKIGKKNHTKHFTNLDTIREQILYCRYGECAVCVVLLFAIILYFPSKPPTPPSFSAALEKVDFRKGFAELFKKRNANVWLVGVPYGLIISIYNLWASLFYVNLRPLHVTESEAGWLGFWAVSAGCVGAILVGRFADVWTGHMKPMILIMCAGTVVTTFAFLLIDQGFIPYSRAGLYICVVLQGIFCNGSIPLFYELAIEATYPVAEAVTSMVVNILYNFIPLLFIVLFLIPGFGKDTWWMDWVMYGSVLLSFPLLLAFQENYKRMDIDKSENNMPETIQEAIQGRACPSM